MSFWTDALCYGLRIPELRRELEAAVRDACQQAAVPLPADVDLRLDDLVEAFLAPRTLGFGLRPSQIRRRYDDALDTRASRLALATYVRLYPPWSRPHRATSYYYYVDCDADALWSWARGIVRAVDERMPSWWAEPHKAAPTRQDDTDEGDRWDGQQ